MCHLKRLSALYQDAVLSSNPCAHHDSCRGCQAKRTGAGDAQHCNGGLEGEPDHCLRFANAFIITLRVERKDLLVFPFHK